MATVMWSSSLLDLDRIRGFLSSSSPGNPNPNSSSSAPNIHEKLEEEEVMIPVDISASSGCHGPLPQGWEQHLDLKTGQVYYIDWNTCKRTSVDPRKVLEMANERVRQLIMRAQERAHLGLATSHPYHFYYDWPHDNRSSECCITSAESSMSINNDNVGTTDDEEDTDGDEEDVGDPNWVEDKQEEDHMDVEGIGTSSSPHHEMGLDDDSKQGDTCIGPGPGHMDCLILFDTCGLARLHNTGSPRPQELLELMGCHHCHSRFVIHRANPWCPSCGMSLV